MLARARTKLDQPWRRAVAVGIYTRSDERRGSRGGEDGQVKRQKERGRERERESNRPAVDLAARIDFERGSARVTFANIHIHIPLYWYSCI